MKQDPVQGPSAELEIETPRLVLRRLSLDDSTFILELLNDPAWLRYIGDRGVRNLDDARNYLVTGPITMYTQHGFGLYMTLRKADGVPVGMSGLLKRDFLDVPDLGFAFLPGHRGQGYAREASIAVLDQARTLLELPRIAAITSPENERSIRLLERLGFAFDKMLDPPPDGRETSLYMKNL